MDNCAFAERLDIDRELEGVSVYTIRLEHWTGHDGLLSRDELARAERFQIVAARQRLVAARSALRTLLGLHLGEHPASLKFAFGEFGKPFLPAHPDVNFNLAHSDDQMIFALSRSGPVGVDCERVRRVDERVGLQHLACSDIERDLLRRHDQEFDSTELFFRLWTRKEALLKALGWGLSFPLNELTVLDASDGAHVTVEVPQFGAWQIASVTVGQIYAAACCTRAM
jgi:4'-phosphopantetheinyl transferase